MAATVKHFAAYGATEAGREYNTVDMSTQRLFNDYLPPYQAAVNAGAATVMSSFNSLNGVPASANPYLLQKILRQMWDFDGAVVSDYQAIQELVEFGFATDEQDAARLALIAGVDIEMGVQVPSINSTYPNFGPALVKAGKCRSGPGELRRAARAAPEVPGRDVRSPVHRPDPGADRRVDGGQSGDRTFDGR